MANVLIVAIGNEMRGDDSAGQMLVERLRPAGGMQVLDTGTVPESFIGKIRDAGADTIMLVDAVDFGGQPGSTAVFRADDIPERWCTTHRAPLGILMRFLAEETGAEVLLVGIQPKQIGQGAPASTEVESSVAALAEMMNRDISAAIGALSAGG